MKSYKIIRGILLPMVMIICHVNLWGQKEHYKNPKYGPDSLSRVSCAINLSEMNEYMKVDLPEYALPAWRKVFENCPSASKNIYINGVKIFQDLIEKTNEPVLKNAYFDTLMLIYDKRIEYFGEEGIVLARKGKDILKYNNKDFSTAYSVLEKSFNLTVIDSDPVANVGLIETGVLMHRAGKISTSTLIENYLSVYLITYKQLNAGAKPDVCNQVFTRIKSAISKADITDCSQIEEVSRNKLRSEKSDTSTISLIIDLLGIFDCSNTDFFGETYSLLYSLNPKPELAYNLARYFLRKDIKDSTIYYFNKAIETEIDNSRKADYQYQLALLYNSKYNDQQNAVKYAKNAVGLVPGWGEPYFTIANAYIQSSRDCFKDNFEIGAVYWLAVDYCLKAQNSDISLKQKAEDLIGEFSKFFPGTEDVFFQGLKEGDSYMVGCWIGEKTTVRVKK